jgi:hypothetical protein
MIYYFYKIVNKINNKIYYGVHKTKNIDDGYMGSGIAIKRAVKKYKKHNFSKKIIKFFENEKDAYDFEKKFVNKDIVKNSNTYNMTLGGYGGFSHIDSKGEKNPMFGKSDKMKEIQNRPEVALKKSIAMTKENRKRYDNGYVNPIKGTNNYWNDIEKSKKARKKMSENHVDCDGENNTFFGKKHSKKSIERMSEKHKNRKKIECPHCSKVGDISNMTRWHLDNCKKIRSV